MKIPIIAIGNSRGIRIPKAMLEQVGIKDDVDLSVHNHQLLLSPIRQAREGWAESFQAMAAQGDDRLLDAQATEWDELEWQW